MSDSKFVMASIHVPVEITAEGKQITHTQLYRVEFSPIDQLPPMHEKPAFVDVADVANEIDYTPEHNADYEPEFRFHSTLEQSDEDDDGLCALTVSKTEIRGPRPYPQSRTFRRNERGKPHRYSRKSDSRFTHVHLSMIDQA